ncbi:MAG: cytidine deaminase [Saprospiraceae bacterium]|nr:cytidine deaminase [Saprospiraceae bacterium]
MIKKSVKVEYSEYETLEELDEIDNKLINKAIEIAKKSYSPYSQFPVGAAVLLDNGKIFAGNNQENIAYPSGTCAERSVLNYVHGNFPKNRIKILAVTALNTASLIPVSPCGFCRQVIVEMERLQGEPMKVILHKIGGSTFVFDAAFALLPLAFDDDILKNKE